MPNTFPALHEIYMRDGVTRGLMEVFLGSGTPDKFKIRPRSRTRQKAAPGIPPGYPRYTIFRCTPDSSNASISWMGRMKWEARERERGGGARRVYMEGSKT